MSFADSQDIGIILSSSRHCLELDKRKAKKVDELKDGNKSKTTRLSGDWRDGWIQC